MTERVVKRRVVLAVAHELRTATAAQLLWSGILAAETTDAAGRAEALRAIDASAQMQFALLDELEAAVGAAARAGPRSAPTLTLRAVVEAAVDEARWHARSTGVTLLFECSVEASCREPDATRIRHAVASILGHAIAHADGGGGVAVRVQSGDEHPEIVVRATGSAVRPGPDPGAGLSAARYLIDAMGGAIVVARSEDNGASTVTAVLRNVRPQRPSQGARVPAGVSILVVDDDPLLCRALALTLRAAGARVAASTTTAGGLSAARRQRWDLIVCDLALGNAAEMSFAARLHALPERAGGPTPVVVLTGRPGDARLSEAPPGSIAAVLRKPIRGAELVRALAAVRRATEPRTDP